MDVVPPGDLMLFGPDETGAVYAVSPELGRYAIWHVSEVVEAIFEILSPYGRFTCAYCGGTFDKGWSDEEASAELAGDFPDVGEDECNLVCDGCYQALQERIDAAAAEVAIQ